MKFREKLAVLALVLVLALTLNLGFLGSLAPAHIVATNDVGTIMDGYRATPHLWPDSLRWWTGGFIQTQIKSLRPLTAYLYWANCWIGVRYGYGWTACLTYALFVACCLLASALAWRLTRSRACVVLAALLGVQLQNYNAGTPPDWLSWWPVQDNLLMIVFFLGAVLCFDVWFETARPRFLAGTWLCFVAACLTKEYAYIFPLFAVSAVLLRRSGARVTPRQGWMQIAGFALFLLALVLYRHAVIPHARDPHLKRIHLIRKPFLYLYHPFYRNVLTELYWLPGLAVLLFALGGVAVRLRARWGARLNRLAPMLSLTAVFALAVSLYLSATYSVDEAFWFLFDPFNRGDNLLLLASMVGTIYSVFLLCKYRRLQPTLLAWAWMVSAYIPVITYLGWHYTLAGWFVRCAYWPLVAKLVWIDVGQPLKRWLSPVAAPDRIPEPRMQSGLDG